MAKYVEYEAIIEANRRANKELFGREVHKDAIRNQPQPEEPSALGTKQTSRTVTREQSR
jgi:hypothetical protein